MTRDDLIDKIKVKMDEITPFDDGVTFAGTDIKPIVSYIEDYLQSSCDDLLMICPLYLCGKTEFDGDITDGETLNNRIIGELEVPDDFLRVHTVKMSGWERPVHISIGVEDADYQFQLNPYTMGGSAKPVIVKTPELLYLYSYLDGDTCSEKTYVARVDMTDSTIDINDSLINPLCALVAANVYGVFGSEEQKIMLQEVETFLKTR